jgi:membrane fusion protein (multidrug efflux system)
MNATPFRATLRTLNAERPAWERLSVLGVLAVALGWSLWAVLGRVSVVAVSDDARLQVEGEVSLVQSPTPGQVAEVSATLGTWVARGDPLFVLSGIQSREALAGEIAWAEALERQLAAIRAEREAVEAGTSASDAGHASAVASQRARLEAARIGAREASRALDAVTGLAEVKAASADAQERAAADAERAEAALRAAEQELALVSAGGRSEGSDRTARIQALVRDEAELEGTLARSRRDIAALEAAVEQRTVAAPVAGRIGELSPLRPGAVVAEGERLATIVPEGPLGAVARFPAGQAIGRIAPGQPARIRLDGFGWVTWGAVRGVVRTVSSEPREGQIRVELTLDETSTRVALAHGMPGTVEIEVERVRPLGLLLRAAGAW